MRDTGTVVGTSSAGDPTRPQKLQLDSDTDRGEASGGWGWIIYATVMLLIAGAVNVMFGIAAIAKSSFFTQNGHYVVGSLNTWGWVLTALGAVQLCVCLGLWSGVGLVRWTGVACAAINLVIWLLFIPAYPFLSIAAVALALIVVYALAVHGGWPQKA
jgi:hypothetical protein